MADNINDLIGQKVFTDIEKLDAQMEILEKRFTTTAMAAVAMAASLGDFSKIKELAKQVDDIDGKLKKLNNTQKEYTLTQAAIDVQSSKNRRALKEQAEAANDLTNGYRRLELEQKKAEQEAKQMAVTYGITSKAFQEAAAKSNGMLNQLKAIDAQLGKAQRNVGNYGQAVFSLSQVFRELPSFAYSASQGVLALSNNLPILVDNFQSVVNTEKSVTAALGVFARSIFSFGNIFTLAISALTIWMARTEMAKNKTKEAAEAVDEYTSQISKETALLIVLKKAIEDTSQPMEKRISAINMLKETWPEQFKILSTEALLTGQVANAYNAAADAIKRKAKANVALKDAEELVVKINKANEELLQLQQKYSIGTDFTSTPFSEAQVRNSALILEAKRAEIALLEKQLETVTKINVENTDIYGGGKKTRTQKANNRIKDLEAEYKAESDVRRQAFFEGEISAMQYYVKLYTLAEKYKGHRKGLNKEELQTEKDFNADLSQNQAKYFDEISQLLEKDWQNKKRYFKKEYEEHLKLINDKIKWDDLYTQYVKGQLDAQDRMLAEEDRQMMEHMREFNAWLEGYARIGESTLNIVSAISDGVFARKMQQFDAEDKRLQNYYDNELRFIEQSGLSQNKKEKAKQKLEAETEAKKKQIDRDRITAQRKQAQLQKALDINQIIANIALGVTQALLDKTVPNPYLRILNAAVIGASGAVQLAKVISQPLPQYAKGRKGGKAEFAVVGEQGHEVIRHADGSMELTPNRPTVTFLPEGADVIPNHELLKQAAYVKLQGVQNITSDKYGAALLAAFEENTKETRELKQIMASKEYSMKIKTLDGYRSFIESKLR